MPLPAPPLLLLLTSLRTAAAIHVRMPSLLLRCCLPSRPTKVTTVQFMDLTENQLLVLDLLPSGSTGYSVSGLKCLFAGAISTSVLNFALIILLGVDSLSGGEKKAEEGKASAV